MASSQFIHLSVTDISLWIDDVFDDVAVVEDRFEVDVVDCFDLADIAKRLVGFEVAPPHRVGDL